MCEGDEKCIQSVGGKTERNETLRKRRRSGRIILKGILKI
jgi:hypothetical protein